jgi:hypothetical protein
VIEEQKGSTEAENTLEDLGFDTLPISPETVCNEINDDNFKLVLEHKPFNSDAILGKAIGNEKGALIYVNSNIPDKGRLNYTAAHEVGHACMHIMPSITQQSFNCGRKELTDQFNDPIEKEANGFASGLLMPKQLIKPLTDGDINWFNVNAIKDNCLTSLEASFRRMISIYKDPAAMVIHKSGQFYRFVSSKSFEPFINRSPLSSEQKELCYDGLTDNLSTEFETVDAIDWITPEFKGNKLEAIYSSSIALKNGFTYTMLRYDDDCFEEME